MAGAAMVLCALLAASAAGSQVPALPGSGARRAVLGLGEIFTIFFIMLGPIKIIPVFVNMTANASERLRRQMAWRGFLLSCIALVVASVLGQVMLVKWKISLAALIMALGVVLFLVALRIVLSVYEKEKSAAGPPPSPSLEMAASPLTFPTIVTPYGTAALIVLLAATTDIGRQVSIFGLVLGVMIINLLTMLYAHQILRWIGKTALQILGAVLGILQVALSIQIIFLALSRIGVIAPGSFP